MKTRISKLKIFEAFVLCALSIQFIVVGVIYLLYKQWTMGLIIVFTIFLIGIVGQGLKHNRKKSVRELPVGQDLKSNEQGSQEQEDGLTAEEQKLIGKPSFITCWIVSITFIIILFHHGFRWFLAIPVGFFVGMIYPLGLFFLGTYIMRAKD